MTGEPPDPGARLNEMRRERNRAKVDGAGLAPDVKASMALPKIEELEARAREILETGDPVGFFLDEFNRIHEGDRTIGKLLLASIGSQLCTNTDGIHIGLFGDSGTGKSDCGKAMFSLLSPAFKLTGSLSDKALFYAGFKEKLLYFVDELTMITEPQEAVIREAISNFQLGTTRLTVDTQLKPRELKIPPRLAFWFTKQDMAITLQFHNRLFNLNPDSSKELDQRIFEASTRRGIEGINRWEETAGVRVCQAMDEILKNLDPVIVKIPFLGKVKWYGKLSDRRQWERFQDTIKAFTALNQLQRERDEAGNVIASREDFKSAVDVWNVIRRSQIYKTDNNGFQVLQIITDRGEDEGDWKYLSTASIAELLNWNRGKVHRVIYGGPKTGDLERGLNKLDFFKLEEGTKTIEIAEGLMRKTVPHHVAYVKKGWDRLAGFSVIASLEEEK